MAVAGPRRDSQCGSGSGNAGRDRGQRIAQRIRRLLVAGEMRDVPTANMDKGTMGVHVRQGVPQRGLPRRYQYNGNQQPQCAAQCH
jgi:hypothetical protein